MSYKQRANWILTILICLLIIMAYVRHTYPHNFYFQALNFVLEAALVGGIADWFAVTALFRRPLGIPFHTALIPRNRQKVIDGLADMVEKELISDKILRDKLETVDYFDIIVSYIEKKNGLSWLAQTLIHRLHSVDPQRVARSLSGSLLAGLKEFHLNAWLSQATRQELQDEKLDRLLDTGVNQLILWGNEERTKVFIREMLVESFPKLASGNSKFSALANSALQSSGVLDLEEAAETICAELRKLFQQMLDPAHPLRVPVKHRINEITSKMDEDPVWQALIESWKNEILDSIHWEEFLTGLIREHLTSEALNTPVNLLLNWLQEYILSIWDSMKENADIKSRFNQYGMAAIMKLLQGNKNFIGATVRSTLWALDDQDLNQLIENKAGQELQWIRINGSVVGAVIGLIVFCFLSFVHEPYIVPFMQQWFQLI